MYGRDAYFSIRLSSANRMKSNEDKSAEDN